MYISLIDKLSDLDKKRINNYLSLYGSSYIDHLDAEEWLEQWSHSNQTLYHTLGDNLIVEVPAKIKKSDRIIDEEIAQLRRDFYPGFREIVDDFCDYNKIDEIEARKILTILNSQPLKNNKIFFSVKIPLKNGSVFQLQEGMKIVRAINKIIGAVKKCSYASDKLYQQTLDSFIKDFKQFENTYSIILNEQYIQGTLCFSIHPLDFMTMSDNSMNWSSCMSWTDEGCYRVGTIEMMNSNNVICVYIKSNNLKYYFNQENKSDEYCWNNKKWRQLFYVTKDILCSGKSYPFCFEEDIQIFILSTLKDIVTKNTNWNYEFGPELYQDMIHIHSKYRMDNNRAWIKYGDTKKHNIIFDTKGMYNDMLNDVNYKYYCFRNKVKKNKIISVSGKANCICCNSSLSVPSDEMNEDFGDYNERYLYSYRLICNSCWSQVPTCESCNSLNPTYKYIKIKHEVGDVTYYCERCFEEEFRICPCCGKLFNFEDLSHIPNNNKLFAKFFDIDYDNLMTKTIVGTYWYRTHRNLSENKEAALESYKKILRKDNANGILQLGCCLDCHIELTKAENEHKVWEYFAIHPYQFWLQSNKDKIKETTKIVKIVKDPNLIEKLAYYNLSKPEQGKDFYEVKYSQSQAVAIIGPVYQEKD